MERQAIGRTSESGFSTTAVKANGFVFTTGNIGTDHSTGQMPEDVETQTVNTLDTLLRVIEQAGSSLADVIKVNVYLDEIDADFDRMNAAYAEYFKARGIAEPPARTTVGCRLPWSKVEIDLIALAG